MPTSSTIKYVETDSTVFKARFVAHGNPDKEKYLVVHDSITALPSSVRLLLALAGIMGFDVWTEDVSQAFL